VSARIGSFLYSAEVDGVRYDVFGRYGDDPADGYIGHDVLDEAGNRLTESRPLTRLPEEGHIRVLARWWRADRTVWVEATPIGWHVVAIGGKVNLALNAEWWPT
jgi:hypothetical protein